MNQASDKAIINWQSFSVGRGETVSFNQPSVSSVTLNRVVGNEASVIAGALKANGQVFLVNSNGILFSQGSQVNVGGLVASTLDISDANFIAGKYTFEGSSPASVINQGHIRASNGGYVALLGKSVSNDGVISATLGTVAFGAGRKITLNFEGNSLVDVTIDDGVLNALVENKGALKADGGRVILTAKAADAILSAQVNNSGIIQARSMASLKGGSSNTVRVGTIKLTANGGSVTSTGKLDASAKKRGNDGTKKNLEGGTVSLAATGGGVTLAGEVDVSSLSGTGGTVTVTGPDVALASTAAIKADGAAGGTILIGGDRHGGSDPTENFIAQTLATAATTSIAAGAVLSANGSKGNGGNVVIWSDQRTDYAGAITATGAGSTGNGGFAEVSSEGVLGFTGSVNLSSAHGAAGTLLLDPFNVAISNDPDSGSTINNGTLTPINTSVINVSTLVAALATANVTITTNTIGTNPGSISIDSPLNWTTPHTLTLTAANDIAINAAVSWGTGGGLTAIATAGNVNVNAPITWSAGTLSLNAGKNVYVNNILTATGAGNFVETNGVGTNTDGSAYGLYMAYNASAYTGRIDMSSTGTVTLNGIRYDVIQTVSRLATAETNLSGNYVLGANIAGLAYSDLAAFGFSSVRTFGGQFVGLGHSLGVAVSSDLSIGNVTVPTNVTLTTFKLASSGDLTVNAPVSMTSGLLMLSATQNVNVNSTIVAGNGLNISSGTGDVNINAPITSAYSAARLYFYAGNNIYINVPIVESGSSSWLYLFYGGTTGSNTTAVSGTNYYIDTAGGASVTFGGTRFRVNGQNYLFIRNATDLVDFLNGDIDSTNYAVVNNIDMSSTPLSELNAAKLTFSGNLAGLGHTINNLTINSTGNAALFNTVDSSGSIRDLGITVASITAASDNFAGAAAIALENKGSIFNTYVTGVGANASINSTGGVGGLVNHNDGAITYSYISNLTLNSPGGAGGLAAGTGFNSVIDHSHADNLVINIAPGGVSVGGLLGGNLGQLTNSYATVTIVAGNGTRVIGGAVGDNDGVIDSVTVSGSITVNGDGGIIGGFVGNNSGLLGVATINNSASYVNIIVTGTGDTIGGFAGLNGYFGPDRGLITNASAYGTIDVRGPFSYDIGAIVGRADAGNVSNTSTAVTCVNSACSDIGTSITGTYDPCLQIHCGPSAPPAPPVVTPPPVVTVPPPVTPPSPPVTLPPSTSPVQNLGSSGSGGNVSSPVSDAGTTGTTISSPASNAGPSLSQNTQGTSAQSVAVASGLSSQAAQAAGSSTAGVNNSRLGASQTVDLTQTASINPGSSSDIVSGQPSAITTPPPARRKEKKELKTAIASPKRKPDAGYGADIKSITIDGEKFDLQNESPKPAAPE